MLGWLPNLDFAGGYRDELETYEWRVTANEDVRSLRQAVQRIDTILKSVRGAVDNIRDRMGPHGV